MKDFRLSKDKSSSFVEYYIEDKKEDKITIYFSDKSFLKVESSDFLKETLDAKQLVQVEDYNYREHKRKTTTKKNDEIDNVLKINSSAMILSMFLMCLTYTFSGFATILSLIPVVVTSSLTLSYYAKRLIEKNHYKKFNLFLENKRAINEKIDKINEKRWKKELENTNSNNPPVKKQYVKNLCINDVNFMSYWQMKKMVDSLNQEKTCYAALSRYPSM